VLSGVLAVCLRLLCATIRWKVEGLEHLKPFWGAGAPVIVACWHGRLVMIPFAWLRHGGGRIYVLMGLNRNGELITRIVSRFNMKAIRGGSRSGGKEARDEMAKAVAQDPATTLALTPDGPHGPALVSKMGMAHLSRAASLPVIWVSAAAAWSVRLGTWDRMQLPLPFSRVTVRFSAPMFPATWAASSLDEYREALDRAGRDELARLDAGQA
jgi:lysophospholipid acyltransferase (LPLAT)-like uncharacterized protein